MSFATKIGRLHIYDVVKAAFIAAVTAPLETIIEYLDKGELPYGLDWKRIGVTALVAFLAYIIKQLLTNKEGKIIRKEITFTSHQ